MDDGCWDIVCDCITDEVCPGPVPSAAVNGAPSGKPDLGASNVIASRMFYVNVAAMEEALAGSGGG